MTISLDELEALAKAATPVGEWFDVDHVGRGMLTTGPERQFIAACDPATILKLLAVCQAAKAAEHALPYKVLNDTSYPISFQEKADASMAVLREALRALEAP